VPYYSDRDPKLPTLRFTLGLGAALVVATVVAALLAATITMIDLPLLLSPTKQLNLPASH
jgi:hypothetical protein